MVKKLQESEEKLNRGQWYVYIIETNAGLFYTGITNNMLRRFEEHLDSRKKGKGAKFFHFDRPKKIVYLEKVLNRSKASKKEAFIKKMTKAKKTELIRSFSKESREAMSEIGFG